MSDAFDLSIVIAGPAGQSVQPLAELLGRAFVRGGYEVFASQSVTSRIRDGHNFSRVRIADHPVMADGDKAVLVVALEPQLARFHFDDLDGRGVVLTDDSVEIERQDGLEVVQGPLRVLAKKHGGDEAMAGSVALGAVLGLMEYDFDILVGLLEERFSPGGGEAAGRNIACAQAGYELIRSRARRGTLAKVGPIERAKQRLFMSGSQAMALGAVAGGVRVAAGCTRSPGTGMLEILASWSGQTGVIVESVEDEVAAINLAIGASFAGGLGLVATAGPGFALMNEGMSLAGMTETPVVVCVEMRSGPATMTAQGDLLSAIHSGHGEFPRVVLVPADAKQAFDAVRRACHLATRYQTPAVVLFDQYLADAFWTVEESDVKATRPVRPSDNAEWRGTQPYTYRRYELTDSGVSPRILPGHSVQLVRADSDEHTVAGHITESAEMRDEMVAKRARKIKGLARELRGPDVSADADAGTSVLCFGSVGGVVREAASRLRSKGHRLILVHLSDLWPFPAEAVREAVGRTAQLLTVEGNYCGQLARLLTRESRLRIAGTVFRFDGRQLTVVEVEQGIEQYLGAGD